MSVRHGVALSVLVVVAGCSGESSVEERMFTTADARKLAQIRPANEEWGSPWPKHPIPPPTDPSSTGASAPADPVLAAIEAELAAVPSLDGAGNKWRDEGEKTANLVVGVHPTADDAKRFLAPFNDFSRYWGETLGAVVKDEAVDDLGDEAWRFWFVPGAQATYHWRRSNLTFEVHMDCLYMCADVDAALHDWATEIDRAARDL